MARDIEMTEEAEEAEVEESAAANTPDTEGSDDSQSEHEEQSHQKPELSDEDYSRAVRKRINKEVAKRKAAEDAFNSARAQAEEAARRAEELEDRLGAIEADRLKKIKMEKQELLREAIVESDIEAQNTLMGEILDLHAQEKEFAGRQAQKSAPRAESAPGPALTTKIHPSAVAFMDRNEWYQSNTQAAQRAMELENELKKEGYELGDDLYEELESRIYKELPELDDLHREAASIRTKRDGSRQPVVSAAGRGGGRPPAPRDSSNHMSKDAQATMRRYGLDPDNPDHIKGFLKHHRGA